MKTWCCSARVVVGNGNALNNTITGNAANNTLNGFAGSDTLIGGDGADTFVFSTLLGAGNVDTISDFSVVDDTISLSSALFNLSVGALDPAFFHIGDAAADADDRIIYDAATGALYFDSDGNGIDAAVQFATLTAGLSLTSSDFIISGP